MDTHERNQMQLEGADYALSRMIETMAAAANELGEFQRALREETIERGGRFYAHELHNLRGNLRTQLATYHGRAAQVAEYGLNALNHIASVVPAEDDIPTSNARDDAYWRSQPDSAREPATEEDS